MLFLFIRHFKYTEAARLVSSVTIFVEGFLPNTWVCYKMIFLRMSLVCLNARTISLQQTFTTVFGVKQRDQIHKYSLRYRYWENVAYDNITTISWLCMFCYTEKNLWVPVYMTHIYMGISCAIVVKIKSGSAWLSAPGFAIQLNSEIFGGHIGSFIRSRFI